MTIGNEQAIISEMIMSMMGVDRFAYVKKITSEEEKGYAVHAADGTQLAVFENQQDAFVSIIKHNLQPVSIH